MKFSIAFICVTLVLIGYANSHCTKCCNSPNYHSLHGPLKVFYEGEKCDCGRTIPVHVERLAFQPAKPPKSYEYEVETVPVPKEPSYGSYSFHKETVNVRPGSEPHVYSYYVDRMVMPNEDCKEDGYKDSYPKCDIVKVVKPEPECGACGNCPCNCHLRKSRSHGRLNHILTGEHDVVHFRYDDKNKETFLRKKRYVPTFNAPQKAIFPNLFQFPPPAKLPTAPLIELKEKVVEKCGYNYQSCGQRGHKCPECFNCTCVPVNEHVHMDDDELVSAALDPNFVIPDRYDPVLRQEVSSEPEQYTSQMISDYRRLSDILHHRTRMDPAYEGGFMSPAPAKQTEDMIKLLIDLLDNKQDVKAYKTDHFHNPHDWMYIVNTDDLAYKVGHKQFIDILPLNQLEHEQKIKYINNRPRPEMKLPEREPTKKLYSTLDTVANLYQQFKERSPIPISQLLAPVYKTLDLYTEKQVEEEKKTQGLLNALKFKRDTNGTHGVIRLDRNVLEVDSDLLMEDLYKKYMNLLVQVEGRNQEGKKKFKNTEVRVLKLTQEDRNETHEDNTPPNYVFLQEDARVLLGEKLDLSQIEKKLSSGEVETNQQSEEFVT